MYKRQARNGVTEHFKVLIGDLSDKASGTYDVICANIVANAIKALVPGVPALLKKDGVFMASGIIDTRRDEVIDAVKAAGLCVRQVKEKNGDVYKRQGRRHPGRNNRFCPCISRIRRRTYS